VRAVQVGGPLGAYSADVAVRHRRWTTRRWPPRSGLLGHGGVVVFDDTVDMAAQARFAMEFCAVESCGKCTPCRIGSTRGVEVHRPDHRGARIVEANHRAARSTCADRADRRLAVRAWAA
jgi:formate dehydrogenase iron-sulfur subunit